MLLLATLTVMTSVSMGVVHPLVVRLCEDKVFKTSLGVCCGMLVCFVHECLRQVPSFLSIPVTCAATLPNHAWAPNDGEDFLSNMWIFNSLPSPNKDLPMKACYSSPRVNTRSLYANNPQIYTRPQYFHRGRMGRSVWF